MLLVRCHWDNLDWTKRNTYSTPPEQRIILEAIKHNHMKVLTTTYERDILHYPLYLFVTWSPHDDEFSIFTVPPDDLEFDFRAHFNLQYDVPQKKNLIVEDSTLSQQQTRPLQGATQTIISASPQATPNNRHLEVSIPQHITSRTRLDLVKAAYKEKEVRRRVPQDSSEIKEHIQLLIDIYTDLLSANVDLQILKSVEHRYANHGLILIRDVDVPFDSERHISVGSVELVQSAFPNYVAQIIRAGLMTKEGEVLVSAQVTRYVALHKK